MTQLRVMNSNGTEEFRRYISSMKDKATVSKPDLNSLEYSIPYQKNCEIDENVTFNTKISLGKYLDNCFHGSGIMREEITADAGIWTWLSYIWFEQITAGTDGERKIGKEYRYIFSEDYKIRYRHLIWLPYDMLSRYGEDASKLFLYGNVNVQGDYIEQVVSKMALYSNGQIIEVATKLYFDRERNTPKKGVQSDSRPGYLRRFKTVLEQLDLTYDLYSSSAKEIISLLPVEFSQWID